jgi:hypothetical protein
MTKLPDMTPNAMYYCAKPAGHEGVCSAVPFEDSKMFTSLIGVHDYKPATIKMPLPVYYK